MSEKLAKRNRIERTIAGEKTDRPPVALWRHWPGDDQDAEALASAHLKWQRDYDWDLLKVSPASSYSVVDWGVTDRWEGHIEGTRTNTFRPVKSLSDWQALRPLAPDQGMLATQLEALRLIVGELKGSVPVLATVFSPLSQAKHLATNDVVLAHLRESPEAFQAGLETITETTIRYIEAAASAGVDGIYYAVQHANYTLMNASEFATYGQATDLRVLQSASGLWCNMVHLHGRNVMFDAVADYPVPLLNWHDRDTSVSLPAGLRRFKGAASGGVSQWTIHQESPEATLDEMVDAWKQVDGRRLVLGTGCVIMTTTPTRNLRAFRNAVESL